MVYILDTNILIYLIRENQTVVTELANLDVFDSKNITSIFIASVGEILSFALQNNWGVQKKANLEKLISNLSPVPIIKREMLDTYAEIDTYSKGKLSSRPLPQGLSARTMGKNDLWIAATTHLLKADIITNDNDFDHLDGIYFNVIKILTA